MELIRREDEANEKESSTDVLDKKEEQIELHKYSEAFEDGTPKFIDTKYLEKDNHNEFAQHQSSCQAKLQI